jgi:hypothetical protein
MQWFSFINTRENIPAPHGVNHVGETELRWDPMLPRTPFGMKRNIPLNSLLDTRCPGREIYVFSDKKSSTIILNGKEFEITLHIDNKILWNSPLVVIEKLYTAAVVHMKQTIHSKLVTKKKITALLESLTPEIQTA